MHVDCTSSLRRVAPLVVAWFLAGPGGTPARLPRLSQATILA